jgi:hypothetical protein
VTDVITVSDGGSCTLPESQTLRKVKEYTYGNFNIKINNVESFVFSPTFIIMKSRRVAGCFFDVDTEYPEGGAVIISDTVIPDSNFLEVAIVYMAPEGGSFTYLIEVTREAEYIPDSNCYLASLR